MFVDTSIVTKSHTFTTPDLPSRIEDILTALNAAKTQAVMFLDGVGLEDGSWAITTDGCILIELAVDVPQLPIVLEFGLASIRRGDSLTDVIILPTWDIHDFGWTRRARHICRDQWKTEMKR
ncbi:hypothetical protein BLNAU_13244 [Blattamonas nauphoetae]|uniref:Uncharacterized protein n=1 Tax=Blattamonas nauphoetae TaxID=2049346 RepID=A0ABQ9XJG4_9EUKA|nr:hypothetical protein BLNAU_13244 [Blattamonas nauphoetae]